MPTSSSTEASPPNNNFDPLLNLPPQSMWTAARKSKILQYAQEQRSGGGVDGGDTPLEQKQQQAGGVEDANDNKRGEWGEEQWEVLGKIMGGGQPRWKQKLAAGVDWMWKSFLKMASWGVRFLLAPRNDFVTRYVNLTVWSAVATVALYFLNPALMMEIVFFGYRLFGRDMMSQALQVFATGQVAGVLGMGVVAGIRWLLSPAREGRVRSFGQWCEKWFGKISFALSCLLFDPRMLAGFLGESSKNTVQLSRRIPFARLLNLAAWGGILYAIGLVPILNTSLSGIFEGLSFLGFGSLTVPGVLGLIGVVAALLGQAVGAIKEGRPEGSKFGTFMYRLLLDPRVAVREGGVGNKHYADATSKGVDRAKRLGFGFLNICIWAGMAFLAVFALPDAALNVLDKGMMMVAAPLLGAVAAMMGQVWVWGSKIDAVIAADEAELDNRTVKELVGVDVKEENTTSYDFLDRAWWGGNGHRPAVPSDRGGCGSEPMGYQVGFFSHDPQNLSGAPQNMRAMCGLRNESPETGISGMCRAPEDVQYYWAATPGFVSRPE